MDKENLTPVTKEMLDREIRKDFIDATFMNDILILNIEQSVMNDIEEAAETLDFRIGLNSLSEKFREEFNYYFGNFIFGLVLSLVFMSFGLLIVYWIISSSLKIFQQDIRLHRVMGLTNRKITNNFKLLREASGVLSLSSQSYPSLIPEVDTFGLLAIILSSFVK